MSRTSMAYRVVFYVHVTFTVMLIVTALVTGWWVVRTIRKYRK